MFSRVTSVSKSYAVEIRVETKASAIHRTLVLTLDYSGSMAGRPIEYGRMATAAALRKAVNEFDDIVLIIYNHAVEEIVVNKANIDEVARRVESWRSSGATDFIKVFQSIQKILLQRQTKYKNKVDLRVSFFTDGKHYTSNYGNAYTPRKEHDRLYAISIQEMYDSLNQFKTAMKDPSITEASGNTTIVARGYSDGNDLNVLNLISAAGLTPGNYKYASTAKEITDIMTSDDVLSGNRVSVNLRVVTPAGTTVHRLDLSEIDGDAESIYTHGGILFIPKSDFGDVGECKVFLDMDDAKHVVPFDVQAQIPIAEFVSIASQYCGHEILAVTKDVVAMNASGVAVTASKHRLRNLDQYLDTVWGLIQKTKVRTLRKRLAEDFKSMKTQIHDMNDRVAQLSRNGVTNDRMSQLLSAGHSAQYITKAGFRNRLNKRLDKNISAMETDDAAIEAAINMFDDKKFEDDLGDDTPSCYITLSPWYELAKNGDMLCMTGMMARSEVAIVDPSKIKFSKVYPMVNTMSFGTFQDELMVKLDKNMKTEDQLHGGFAFNFQTPSGVVTALSNQHVNFVYPLYICAEHWNIAKHLITRNLGWMATLDWAGHDFQQIKTIPFVLLTNAITTLCSNGTTEAGIQKFFNIARVAKQLIVDYNMKTVNEDFQNWLKSPLHRTGDAVKDIFIFLIKLLFLSERPDLDDAFWLSIIEEVSRRALLSKVRQDEGSAYDITSLASHHNFKQDVVPVKKTSSNVSHFRLSMMTRINSSGVDYTDEDTDDEKADSPPDCPVFDSSECQTTPAMMAPVLANEKKIQHHIQFIMVIKTLYEFMNHREIYMDDLYAKLDANYGIITSDHIAAFTGLDLRTVNREYYSVGDIFNVPDIQLYAMFLQNNNHPQHAKRRDAAESGSYVNPFTDDSHSLIQSLVDNAVRTERTRQMTLLQSNVNAEYGILFKKTDDILTAAGIILDKCHNVGDQSFIHLYTQLQDSDETPLFLEKVSLLVEGEYRGIRLYRDLTQPVHWPASWKNMYRIMRTYRTIIERTGSEYSMTKDDWLNIFRWKQEPGGVTVLRAAGEFPPNKNK